MDNLNVGQAREQLELIQRILAESQQRLCSGGEYFVAWGLFSGLTTVAANLVARGIAPPSLLWVVAAALVACIAFSVSRARALSGTLGRESLLQREFFNVLWLTLGIAFLVDVAVFRIFTGLASAAIWSVAAIIVLLYIGMHGNRRAVIAGIVVLTSLVAANFVPPTVSAYVLAAGMVGGYAGFGLSELLSKA